MTVEAVNIQPEPDNFLLATDDLGAALADPDKMDALLARVTAQATALERDVTTEDGRKKVARNIAMVARSKTAIHDAGLAATARLRKAVTLMNQVRDSAVAKLQDLQNDVSAELTSWKAVEEERVSALQHRLNDLQMQDVSGWSADAIRAQIDWISGIPIDPTWQEVEDSAKAVKFETIAKLRKALESAEAAERVAAEQARLQAEIDELRAQAAERDRRDAERRLAEAEAAETAKRLAEAERRGREQAEHDAAERVRQAEANARAAKDAADRAAEIERVRVDRERREAEEAQRKRDEDKRRRGKAMREMAVIIHGMIESVDDSRVQADLIAQALLDGRIPHCTVHL